MPPKRSRKRAAPSPPSNAAQRKTHEIHEAFRLFSLTHADALAQAQDDDDEGAAQELEDLPEDDNGVIRVLDVRRALKSMNLPPPPSDFFDEGRHFLGWENFKELADTMGELEGEEAQGDAMDVDEEQPVKSRRKGKGKEQQASKKERDQAEVDHAFALFTTPIPMNGAFEPGPQDGRRITLTDLKRVARELKEDVDEKVLKMMLLEANGGEGDRDVMNGVGRDEFEAVMKRAKVFA